MTRIYYRLVLTVLCALAAYITPVFTLRYPYVLGYFAGGLAAAFFAWALLAATMAMERELEPKFQLILGAGAGLLSWGRVVSLVALFQVLPLIVHTGHLNDTFDPIWLLGGFSPLVVPVIGFWISRVEAKPYGQALSAALFRFSVPLLVLMLLPRWLGLPKQFRWIFLFTGVMFLVLDGLGTGGPLPLLARRRADRE